MPANGQGTRHPYGLSDPKMPQSHGIPQSSPSQASQGSKLTEKSQSHRPAGPVLGKGDEQTKQQPQEYSMIDRSIYLSTYLPIYLSTYLPIYLPTYLPTYLSIDLSIYRSIDLSIYRSIDLSIYRSIDLSIYRSIDLSIYRSIGLSVYRSIGLSIYRSIDLSIYLSIYESIYLSIHPSIYLYHKSIGVTTCFAMFFFLSLYLYI